MLVTGAAGGIGRAVCRVFEQCGSITYPVDLQPAEAPRFLQGDIRDAGFRARCLQSVLEGQGRLDVLVNNAGICPRTPLPDISPSEWNAVLEVNLTAVFLLSQAAMRIMVEQGSGCIVNMASLSGKVGGIAVGAHYSASKAAIIGLTKTLARYGAPHGIRVNAVAPGVIDTAITRAASVEALEEFRRTIPLRRIGEAHEAAGPVLFLASSLASYITGAVIDANGGLLMD